MIINERVKILIYPFLTLDKQVYIEIIGFAFYKKNQYLLVD